MLRLRLVRILAVVLIHTHLSACATIINTPWQDVQIESVPAGAEAVIEPGHHRLTTPGELRLKRGTRYLATFQLAGHGPVAKQLNPQISAWSYGGLLVCLISIGGIAVMIVDLATGSAYHLEPDPVRVELEPETP